MKVSLVVMYIIVVLFNYLFYVSEAVIGTCSEIYSFETYAKPATRDINHFLIDVSRGLYPCLLPTELA